MVNPRTFKAFNFCFKFKDIQVLYANSARLSSPMIHWISKLLKDSDLFAHFIHYCPYCNGRSNKSNNMVDHVFICGYYVRITMADDTRMSLCCWVKRHNETRAVDPVSSARFKKD